jgi:branched-chain amino acid transport system permease protein
MKRFLNRVKNVVKSPYIAFVGAGLVLIILRLLAGVIPVTFTGALVTTSYYYIAALGFALLLGYGGLASLGTGAFVGIGAFGLHYIYKYLQMPILLAIVGVIVISIVVSLVFGLVSLRISGMYLAIITLGLSQIVVEIIKLIPEYASGVSGGFRSGENPRPLQIFGYGLQSNSALIFIAIIMIICMVIVYNLIKSPTGRALLSIKNSETAAQTMGINLLKYRLLAFTISGIFGTLAGVLSILYTSSADLKQMDLSFALNILAAVVIGGTKSIWGILLGTFVIYGLNLTVFQPLGLGNYTLLIYGVLIILIVMFYPGGLIQVFYDIKKLIKKLIKKRRARIYGEDI